MQDLLSSSGAAAFSPDTLQAIANYRLIRKSLRLSGSYVLLIGIVIGLLGLLALAGTAGTLLAIVGAVFIAEGLWLVAAPTPIGLLVQGLTFILWGGVNLILVVTTLASAAGGAANGVLNGLALDIWVIVWGFRSVGRYREIGVLPPSPPTKEEIDRVGAVIKDVRTSTMASDPNHVEFKAKRFGREHLWDGRLGPVMAVFAKSNKDALFVAKDQVEISDAHKVLIGKALKVKILLGSRAFTGVISPEAFERYEHWKQRSD